MSQPQNDALQILRERGFIQQLSNEAELASRLNAGSATFYVGFDPTAASLHVGSLVPLMAMAHLTRAGHRPIALLGGGTAMVGDPSGRTEMRKMLMPETIQSNRAKLEPQVRKFVAAAGEKALVVDNAEWLGGLKYLEFLREIGSQFSVNRMLAAESYKQRLERGLSFLEFNYQILQAYDFLVLKRRYDCILQMGGDDQWGNILAGMELIRRVERAEAYALTFPLLTTASGAKMGKTAAGAVWLDGTMTKPFDFYQYFVNVDDRDVARMLALFTFLDRGELERLGRLQGADLRQAKHVLAFEITQIVHGQAAAEEARKGALAAFGAGGAGAQAEMPTVGLSKAAVVEGIKFVDLLVSSGLASSKSAARRLIEQGGVRLGDRKIASVEESLQANDVGAEGVLLHAGKKHLRRLKLES